MKKKVCLNLSALIHLGFEEQLAAASSAGFQAVGPREVNVLHYLSGNRTLEDARVLLDEYGLEVAEYDFFPDWIYANDSERIAMCKKFEQFCAAGTTLGDDPILIAPVAHQGRNDVLDLSLAVRNLKELGSIARTGGARVAVEFLPWTRVDSIGLAWDIIAEVDMANVGIVLDTFHYFEGPSTEKDLHSVPVEKITLCHLNDMNPSAGDLLTRTREERVMPGEGVYPFDEVLSYLEKNSYSGYYSLEILNKEYSGKDPKGIAVSAIASLERLLEQY